MSYLSEELLENLKKARTLKGFSQREVSARTGLPQSHISKIESGTVDLRISSLITLARVLDLELFLVPKKSVPAIEAIIRIAQGEQDEADEIKPAYSLDEDADD